MHVPVQVKGKWKESADIIGERMTAFLFVASTIIYLCNLFHPDSSCRTAGEPIICNDTWNNKINKKNRRIYIATYRQINICTCALDTDKHTCIIFIGRASIVCCAIM